MNQQIATQYNNYQELLIDLDIFGRQNEPKQLDLQGYEELFYEEFKQRKPMPTMESKRYKLSRLVDNDYCVEYNKQIELREKEYLIDLTEHSEKKNEKENYEIADEVQDLFTYERQIKNSDREEIIKKYSLDTGEALDYTQIERPDKLLGTIKADESLRLDETEIKNLGSDNPVFHDEEVEPIEDETEDTEEIEDLADYELADLDDDFDEVEEKEKDSSTSSIADSNEENSSTSSIVDSNEENSSTSSNDLSLDSLLKMLEKKIDANIDIEQLKALVKESEKPKAEESEESNTESDSDEESCTNLDNVEESEEPLTESSNSEESEEPLTESSNSEESEEPDTLDDFFEDTEDTEDTEETEEKLTSTDKKKDFDIDVDDFEMDFDDDEEKPKKPKVVKEEQEKPKVVEQKPKVDEPKQETVEQKQEEPKDLREFIRKHPRCEYDFATQYFTPKQIAMEIKKGRVIKRGNLLKI